MNEIQIKAEMQSELSKLIFLNMLSRGIITKEEYFKLRDKLIEELHPIVGELERGTPWLIDE